MNTSVIIIDDDKDTVEVFADFLTIKGIDVKAKGYNGRDAIELYKEYEPDIVLMDVMMPEYDGFFGLRNIKNHSPQSKIIMVTADLSDDTHKKLTELGASKILYKPYEIADVISTIEKIQQV